jgi:hypothetical protein
LKIWKANMKINEEKGKKKPYTPNQIQLDHTSHLGMERSLRCFDRFPSSRLLAIEWRHIRGLKPVAVVYDSNET